MALDAINVGRAAPECEEAIEALERARERTLTLVGDLDDEALERVHSPIMSPLVWDLGHIAAYEDLWIAHRFGGRELLRADLAGVYDAFETPRAIRGEAQALAAAAAREYMQQVRARTAQTLAEAGIGDGAIVEMVIRHELQHGETMLQTLAIAGLLARGEGTPEPLAGAREWLEIPAGEFEMGAPAEGFSYDNERPRHAVCTEAFRIARLPVGNEEWLRFSEEGGYETERWWSQEGWAWNRANGRVQHPAIAAGHPSAPACHVSWFEADAFARANDARLPSEAEWERAATLDGAGMLDGTRRVWEWTESPFAGYPGFVPYPYREYSEVFFGDSYRVLRGGSWATDPRVASPTFRNWDLPERRQIFSGVRLASDAA